MAIACLRLVTFPPLPLRRVPRLRLRIALSTRLLAAFPYFRRVRFAGIALLHVAVNWTSAVRFIMCAFVARLPNNCASL